MTTYVTWKRLHDDIVDFSCCFEGAVGFIGVPRSGTLVANLFGLHMNLPVGDLASFKRGKFWGAGNRLKQKQPKSGKVILMEDSCYTGTGLRRACEHLGGELEPNFKYGNFDIVPAAMYVTGTPPCTWYEQVRGPRLFAWQWMHARAMGRTLFDMDGVLCLDPRVSEDNEEGYVRDIKTLPALWKPSVPIEGIVTHRLDRRRDITKAWLAHHVIKYGSLTMRQEATCHERRKKGDQDGTWKGHVYNASEAILFVESDLMQARRIHDVAGKEVFCPPHDKFFTKERANP